MRCLAFTLLAISATLSPSVAQESFAVVIHQEGVNESVDIPKLRTLFSGTMTHWSNGHRVVLVERDAESPAFNFLLKRILNMSETEYKRHLAKIEFAGREPVIVKVLNSGPAACRFVFNVPNAIAILESEALLAAECSHVGVLRINGKLPGQEGYPLQ